MSFETRYYGGGLLFVPCNIDGHDFRCNVDTGARRSTVANDAFFKNYPIIRKTRIQGASGATMSASIVNVQSWKVGTRELNAVQAWRISPKKKTILSLPQIGMDVMNSKTLLLDFRKKEMSFDLPAPPNLSPMTLDEDYLPAVDVEIGPETVTALFDTGNAITLVDSSLLKKHPELFDKGDVTKATDVDAIDTETNMQFRWLKDMKIDGVSFQGMWVGVLNLSSVSSKALVVLGFNAMTRKNWFFDFENLGFNVQ